MTDQVKFYENPEYSEMIDKWTEYNDLWVGDHMVLTSDKYLPRHELENSRRSGGRELRVFRMKNTFYTKLIDSFIDIWMGLYFRKEGDLNDDAEELLGDAADDIDGEGNSIWGFLRNKVFPMDYVYGRPIIMVDALPIAPVSRQDEIEQGARAYFEILDPRVIPDWSMSFERQGLDSVRYEFSAVAPRSTLALPPTNEFYTRMFVRNSDGEVLSQYFKKEVDQRTGPGKRKVSWKFISSKALEGFEDIPVVWRNFQKSYVDEYVNELRRHHVLESSMDCGLAMQAHQRLVASGIDASDSSAIEALTKYTISIVPAEASITTIEPSDPTALKERIGVTRDAIFKKAMRQVRAMPGDSRAAQSDDTMREEKDNALAIIEARLDDYESMINEALFYYKTFMGRDDLDPQITLNRDITNADVSKAERSLLLFRRELDGLPETRKQLLSSILLDNSLSDVEAVVAELEETDIPRAESDEPDNQGEPSTLETLRNIVS